jgi:hypothetical protein
MPQLARIQPDTQLVPIDIVAPGRLGLNLEQQGSVLTSDYCTQAHNAVLDSFGRLAARNGVAAYSSTAFTVATQTQTVFEYNAGGGSYQQIAIGTNGSAQQVANSWGGVAAAQLGAGTASLATANRWYCQNFNNKLIAFQSGQKPVVYSAGTPLWNLIVESSGTWSTGNGVGCAAFGRVWACKSDGHTIEYSGLLDETDRGSASSGLIDMNAIWVNGTDTVTAIFPFNAALVVCGNHHIVMFTDGRGSTLGLDPSQMYVFDQLTGTGCMSQWTVDYVGEADVVFLAPSGVQSLQRLLSDRNNPTQNLTKYVRTTFMAQALNESASNITGAYNAYLGQYFITMPNSRAVWVLDMKRKYQDDTGNLCAVVTVWDIQTYTVGVDHSFGTYFGTNGKVAQYFGYTDYNGQTYDFNYTSGQMNFQQQEGDQISTRLKMLKRFEAYVYSAGGMNVNLSWTTDFGVSSHSASVALSSSGPAAQFGVAQFGVGQFGGGSYLTLVKYPARARGQYYQIGVSASISGAFALQQIQLATKIGRVA